MYMDLQFMAICSDNVTLYLEHPLATSHCPLLAFTPFEHPLQLIYHDTTET